MRGSFLALVLAFALAGAWAVETSGATVFFDDFEAGVRLDVWGPGGYYQPGPLVPDAEHAFGTQSAKQVAGQFGYMGTTSSAFANPGPIAPGRIEVATAQFWDENVQTGEFAGALMLANHANDDFYQLGVYFAGVPTPERATNYLWRTRVDQWNATPVARTRGWHELRIQAYPFTGNMGDVEFYIDGTKVAEGRRRETSVGSGAGFDLDQVRVGIAAWSANSDFWYDNVSLDIVPEPATLAVLGLGLLLMRRRRA